VLAGGGADAGVFIRGDADLDGSVSITDAIFVLNHLFTGGTAPRCEDPADSNDDGVVDLSDPVTALGALFLGTRSLPAPGPIRPGYDPTPDDTFACGDEPGEATLSADEIFDRLTETAWVSIGGNPQSPHTEHLVLRRDGSFDRCAYADHPLGSPSGSWTFHKRTSGGGSLVLSTGDFLRFLLQRDGSLRIANRVFVPGEYAAGGACNTPSPESCPGCRRQDLPSVALPALALELAGTAWRNANDLDLFRAPTEIIFSESGRYSASFRNGQCSYVGFWSIAGDGIAELWGTRPSVLMELPSPGCNFQNVGALGSYHEGWVVEARGPHLRLGTDIYAPDPDPLQGVLLVTAAGAPRALEITGRYARPLRRGRNACALEVRNLGTEAIGSRTLRVSRQALSRSETAFVVLEDPVILTELNLPEIGPGTAFALEVNLDATGVPINDIRFEIQVSGFTLEPAFFIVSF
jgi:hypothetical protein